MAKIPVTDIDSGEELDEPLHVPDDVLAAAEKVSAWLRTQMGGMELHGLTLANN